MEQKEHDTSSLAMRIALAAVLTAVTAVFTVVVKIPTPTRGYVNLGDVAIYFTAFTFGPVTALIAGGLGTAIADLLAGYAQWAPISLFSHGLQGLAAGLIIKSALGKRKERKPGPYDPMTVPGVIAAGIVGTIIMAGIYFVTGGLMAGFPAAAAGLPGDIMQNVVGLAGGVLLSVSVYKAYPPVRRLSW